MTLELLEKSPAESKPLLCLEVNPPRGIEISSVFERLDNNLEGVDFLNVTDSALAKMRMSSLSFATLLKRRFGIEPLVNFACRDRNVIAMQSDLLGAWALGVKSIIALTGDAVSIGDMPDAKGVFEINSLGLLNIIKQINAGADLAGNALNGAPGYVPGVVVNPNAKNTAAEIKRLIRKKDAGAVYALSQPVFDEVNAEAFFKEASNVGINMFVGLLPFKSGKSALALSKIPGIKISRAITELAETSPETDLTEISLDLCLRLAKITRRYVRGFHVVSGATPKLALELTKRLSEYIKST